MIENIKPIYIKLLAIISGILLTFSFAPFNIFPLAILSPAILLALWLSISPKKAFWLGWLYGLGLFGTGVYWIYISIHTFGNASIFFSLFITGGLIAYLSIFPGLCGYFLNKYFPTPNSFKIIFAFPAIWVFSEWVRSWFLSGFPWLLIGYSQTSSPLKGYAPIFSVFGLSLATVLSSALITLAILKFKRKEYKLTYISLISLLAIWIVGGCLSLISWTKPYGDPSKVSLVQGNIAQEVKWSPEQVQPTVDRYLDLTHPHWDSKIIIWPESAIPLPKHNAKEFLDNIAEKANAHETTFITGIPIKAPEKEGYYNAVIALGKGEGTYMKTRLVPFGEFIPMRETLGRLLDLLNVPMSDFISGNIKSKPLIANGLKIATFICYEIAYPEQVLSHDSDIDMILTVSNDAWFGRSIAQAQHLEMAQMRAMEMGRPILFGSNDGITAIINAKGKVQSAAPQYQSYVLTDEVQPAHGKTPWQYFGMDPLLLLLIIFLIVATRYRKEPC